MAVISGILKDPIGGPRVGVVIELRAVRTSATVVNLARSQSITDETGKYRLTVEPGTYDVNVTAGGHQPARVGGITVALNSKNGTLNDFLTIPGESDLTPEIVATVDRMRAEAAGSAEIATAAAKSLTSELEILELKKSPIISFVFDDAYESHYSIVAPLFESKGLKCGFAINTDALNVTGRLSNNQLINLYRRGFDIINHAQSGVVQSNSVSNQLVKAEVYGAKNVLESLGIDSKIFQAPSSLTGSNHVQIIRSVFEYAFTTAGNGEPMNAMDPIKLRRYGMESITIEKGKTAIDQVKEKNGALVFYAHNVATDDSIYKMTAELIAYAQSSGVRIGSVSETCGVASIAKNTPSYKITHGNLYFNGLNGWGVNANATLATNNVSMELKLTATAAAATLCQKSISIRKRDNVYGRPSEMLTFSTMFRYISGEKPTNTMIGIKTTKTDGSVEYQSEEDITGFDGTNRRYSISFSISNDVVSVLMYVRATFAAVGDVILLRNPILRYGNCIGPDTNLYTTQVFPLPTQTVGPSLSKLTLTSTTATAETNFYFTGNQIVTLRSCKVRLSIVIISDTPGALAAAKGGMLRISQGQDNHEVPLSIAPDIGGVSASLVFDLQPGSNIDFSMYCKGTNFEINNPLCRIEIKELL